MKEAHNCAPLRLETVLNFCMGLPSAKNHLKIGFKNQSRIFVFQSNMLFTKKQAQIFERF